jgi:hypothetical protein
MDVLSKLPTPTGHRKVNKREFEAVGRLHMAWVDAYAGILDALRRAALRKRSLRPLAKQFEAAVLASRMRGEFTLDEFVAGRARPGDRVRLEDLMATSSR